MASSSSPADSTPPRWEKLPPEITVSILQKLGVVEILTTAVKVCPTWRRVCHDPSMWRCIFMEYLSGLTDYELEKMCMHAVDLSQGQLTNIHIQGFGTNDLLSYISQRSSQLRCLQLVNCYDITSVGVKEAITNLPLLEELHLRYIYIDAGAIETIGRSCPLLKSVQLNSCYSEPFVKFDSVALAIAKTMPQLRHLQLLGDKMTDEGLKAILEGCPHLETLDLRECIDVEFSGDLRRLCSERIKDLKLPLDLTNFIVPTSIIVVKRRGIILTPQMMFISQMRGIILTRQMMFISQVRLRSWLKC